jgi:peptidyl-prolyl cis-trans isomerase SurA
MMGYSFDKTTAFLSLVFLGVILSGMVVLPANLKAAEAVVVDRIVAIVNEDIISLFDLNQTLQPYEENIRALGYTPEKQRETLFKLRTDLLSQLIDGKLTDQQIKKNNIKISEQEVDSAIERIKEARAYTAEDLRAGLAEQGLTIEEYRNLLKQQLLRNKLVNREIKSKIVITEEDIKNYYDTHREKYGGEQKYHLWNISIRMSESADEFARRLALEKVEAVLDKLSQGRSFESLAAENPDSSMAPKGADLGLYRLDEISPQLQKVVKDMKAGDISPILETGRGYQIIYVQKVVQTNSKSLADVKSEIQEILYNESVDNRFQTWIEDLRKRSHIKIIK